MRTPSYHARAAPSKECPMSRKKKLPPGLVEANRIKEDFNEAENNLKTLIIVRDVLAIADKERRARCG